jgi:acyl-CoA reductase-like NAD-dependent aldehyde dehydrogenase
MAAVTTIENWDGAADLAPATGTYLDVRSPLDGSVIARVAVSNAADVDAAAQRAQAAFGAWSAKTTKAR